MVDADTRWDRLVVCPLFKSIEGLSLTVSTGDVEAIYRATIEARASHARNGGISIKVNCGRAWVDH